MASTDDFETSFKALTGHGPFPWQQQLYARWLRDGDPPQVCDIPTGLGKTSVIAVWLLALAQRPEHTPRRLVYIVNRRTVIDQTTEEIRRYRETLIHFPQLSGPCQRPSRYVRGPVQRQRAAPGPSVRSADSSPITTNGQQTLRAPRSSAARLT